MSKVIFIPAILKGGAERVAVNLFKALNFDYILLLDDREIAYELPRDKIYSINSPATSNLFKKIINLPIRIIRVKRFKKSKKVSFCLSLLEPANLLNVLTKENEKSVLSFHSHYSLTFSENPFFGKGITRKFLKAMYKLAFMFFYNKADLMVAVSKSAKYDLVKKFGLREEKIKVIYNPIYFDEIQVRKTEPLGEYEAIFKSPVLITAGRLTKPKGQWYLLRVFKALKEDFPDLKLVILGEGELKEYLVDLSEELGLKTFVWDRSKLSENFDVYFLGFQKNPFKFIARAELFVFPSLWEGFGNVLVEAMACGVPALSSDCKSGPREILAPETNFEYQTKEPEFASYGVLMPPFEVKFKGAKEPLEEKELMWVEVIKRLLEDKPLRETYTQKTTERAKEFDIENIIQEWKEVFGA
jgi:glycosyltransferase involved in cell wall biosynthesis